MWHFNLNKSRESGRIVFYLIYKTDFLSFLFNFWHNTVISLIWSVFWSAFVPLSNRISKTNDNGGVGDDFKILVTYLRCWFPTPTGNTHVPRYHQLVCTRVSPPSFQGQNKREILLMNTQSLQLESDLSPQLFSQNKSTLQLTNAKLIISK